MRRVREGEARRVRRGAQAMTLDPTPVAKEKAMAACQAYQQAVDAANRAKTKCAKPPE